MALSAPTNVFGDTISTLYQLASPDFGTGEMGAFGIPVVAWEQWRPDIADEHGFDTHNIEENGAHTITCTLPKGTVIIRFGSELGRYTAPQGTHYEEVSLPYTIESMEYHEYRVVADGLEVRCVVQKGRVAPMFRQPGGGVQYLHEHSIRSLVRGQQVERIK